MSENNEAPIRIGITHGDYNGIGYEVIIKTFVEHGMLELCTPVVYGLHKAATFYRKQLQVNDWSFFGVHEAEKAAKHHCNLLSINDNELDIQPGNVTQHAGNMAVVALEKATNDLIAGKIDVLVTAPINKHNVQSEKFKFPGHTEFLAEKAGVKDFLMLLVSGNLRVGTVTGHIPIQSVAQTLSTERILSKLRILNQSLLQDFGIRKPRIAVLGLNPHAGDNGLIGQEEKNIILPAIEKAQNEGILALGPYAADGFFGGGSWVKFDAILAMYHDQGLIPFKSIAFHSGVNFTAGLPFIRTSPDHGTGYDIAGKNQADPSSIREAVYLAIDIYRQRKLFREISANPLQQLQKRERER
ncbi:MAG: 4-hydroxythreonine-4-phosphate dehydrogenase PdxA [Bacteroidia bacterium]|nr:4-hydroxythreonine-4-phosphate dehydrogenase PdxA [Bacteroidia bacterium]